MRALRRNWCKLLFHTLLIVVFLGVAPLLFTSKLQSEDKPLIEVDLDPYNGRQSEDARGITPSQQVPTVREKLHRVMALTYHEQLYTALKFEMLSLATVAADFNASVVEPLLMSSRMYGLRDLVPLADQQHVNSTVPLGEMLEFGSLLEECTGVDMIPFSTFMDSVPRKVVLVYVQSDRLHRQPREISLEANIQHDIQAQLRSRKDKVVDCTRTFESKQGTLIKKLEQALRKNTSGSPSLSPEVVQVLCLGLMSVVNSSDLWSHFPKALTSGQEDHLIVFLNWRGCFILDCSRDKFEQWKQRDVRWSNQDRYKIITTHSMGSKKCSKSAIPHSKVVKSAAETYLSEHAMIRRPFIGVHIRTERIAKGAVEGRKVAKEFLDCVLKELADAVALAQKNHALQEVLVCTDFDKDHGSDSCGSSFCRETGDYIHSTIEQRFGWNITKFNPSLLGLPEHSGLVALVEMNMLLLSDHLVLVGHGNFQDQLLAVFLSSGKKAYSRIAAASKCSS